jgi:nucleotide-binding universal stress UspA family protein
VTVVPVDPAAPDHSDIVVGIDGSEASRRALGWAADLAAATDRRLTAVAVVPAELWHEQPFFGAETDAVSGAERFVAEAAVDRGAEVAVEVPMGDPATELVERGAHAYLLVVGSRGHTSIGEVVFGSVSRTCATRCDRPVVIVPAGTSSDAAGSASGADRE